MRLVSHFVGTGLKLQDKNKESCLSNNLNFWFSKLLLAWHLSALLQCWKCNQSNYCHLSNKINQRIDDLSTSIKIPNEEFICLGQIYLILSVCMWYHVSPCFFYIFSFLWGWGIAVSTPNLTLVPFFGLELVPNRDLSLKVCKK